LTSDKLKSIANCYWLLAVVEQHPIPQNVTAYQFRLVGDMTLKQFVELASGLLLGFLVTRMPLIPVFIKWPVAGVLAFGGIALAFLPVEERPLDVWLKNFVKSIYAPTQYLWQKRPFLLDFFAYTRGKVPIEPIRPRLKDQRQLRSYLQTLTQPSQPAIDQRETAALGRINQLLGAAPLVLTSPSTQPGMVASPGIKSRRLRTPDELGRGVVVYEQVVDNEKPLQMAPRSKTTPSPAPPQSNPTLQARYRKQKATPIAAETAALGQEPIIEIAPFPRPPLTVATLYPPPIPKRDQEKKRVAPQFSHDLPLPAPPDVANIVVGMVLAPDSRLVVNAIVEMRNNQNQTVRAVKTNKLGQFFIATPLINGDYEIRIEHPEYAFDIIKLRVEGKIIPPLKIKAKQIKPSEPRTQET
jgi:hypothetical protein